MFKLFNIFCASMLCFSCSSRPNTSSYSPTAPKDTIAYSYKTYHENSDYFVGNESSLDTTYFRISYPFFATQNINDSIRKYILVDGENSPTEAARSFIDGFDEFVGDSNIENISASWTKEVNSRIITNTPIFITLATQINEYSGGAHGQHYTMYSNFDLQKFSLIVLKDIIQQNKIKEFTKIAEKYFRRQENLSDQASLSKDFFFEDGIFTLNDNFGLTKNNLIIYYNEYEIKPYSEGPTKLEIPYKDLTELFTIRGHEYIQSIL